MESDKYEEQKQLPNIFFYSFKRAFGNYSNFDIALSIGDNHEIALQIAPLVSYLSLWYPTFFLIWMEAELEDLRPKREPKLRCGWKLGQEIKEHYVYCLRFTFHVLLGIKNPNRIFKVVYNLKFFTLFFYNKSSKLYQLPSNQYTTKLT